MNAEQLKEANIIVPTFLGGTTEHYHLVRAITRGIKNSQLALDSFHELALEESNRETNTLVVSAESMAELSAAEIRRIFKPVYPHFDQVEIVYYVRRQDMAGVSHYSTQLLRGKSDSRKLMSREMGPRSERPFLYCSIVEEWMKAIPCSRAIVRRYWEKWEKPEWSAIADFFEILGYDLSALNFPPTTMNRSLNAASAAYISESNRLLKLGLLPAHKKFIERVHGEVQNRFRTGAPALPSKGRALEFYNSFNIENDRLFDKYLSRDLAFSDDFSFYPEDEIDLIALVDPAVLSEILVESFQAGIDADAMRTTGRKHGVS